MSLKTELHDVYTTAEAVTETSAFSRRFYIFVGWTAILAYAYTAVSLTKKAARAIKS